MSPQRQPVITPAEPSRKTGSHSALAGGLLGLLALGVLIALFALGYLPRVQKNRDLLAAAQASRTEKPLVSVGAVRRSAASAEVVLPGNTQAIEETPIHARADGYLRRRLVDIGDRVEAGQLLAEIETPELEQQIRQARAALEQSRAALLQSRGNLEQARANLQLAEVTFKRWKALVDQGVLSAQSGDERESAFNARKADVQAMEGNVRAAEANVLAGEASVQRLLELQSFQKVAAPFAGVITLRNVDTGALIAAGGSTNNRPMFAMARIGTLRVFVEVPQTYVPSIQPGQAAQVLVQEFPNRAFPGKVVRTANSLDARSHTLRTEVQVSNSDYALLPGMYAQVRFSLSRANPPLLIPAEALLIRPDGPQVVRVDENASVHYQKVELGRDYGTEVEVIRGLRAGERVVINPADDLREGAAVEIVK